MLLVIDVGNTNIVVGIFDGDVLRDDWRVRTERDSTEDEFGVLMAALFSSAGISFSDIDKTVISCVVPPVAAILDSFCRKYMAHAPFWVSAESVSIMPVRYKNPSEVGADRIVNAIAAYHKYKSSLIVIDFGTATTFDAVSGKGEYLGGAIAPGIMIASEALFKKTSRLHRVELLAPPENVIGKDTTSSIQSGIIFGYAGLVDGIVRRMTREMKTVPKVIATGGLSPLMRDVSETIEAVETGLTLDGLKIISGHF